MSNKQKMYKVTLWDSTFPSCCSGTISIYTDNIARFKKDWEKLETDEASKERFNRSLNGEIVTDYYSDSPELNIVQFDENCRIIYKQVHNLKNKEITLYNAYGYPSKYIIKNMLIERLYVKYQGKLLRLDRFKIIGITKINTYDRSDAKYMDVHCWGNPFLKHTNRTERFYCSNNISDFKDKITSICYYETKEFRSISALRYDAKKKFVDNRALEIMLMDIKGEAG